MTRFDRIYKIHDLLRNARQPVPMRVFVEALEASRNTVTRDFEFLRDSLGAPIEYCREQNGHQYAPDSPEFELPGFWMNPTELYALLAWCEQAEALRLFSLDRIHRPSITHQPARRVPEDELDQHTGAGFGIFGGQHKAIAHLRFNEHAARWVAEELWHVDQQGEWKEDGFHLQLPYSDSRELTMEILRYGPDVEVLGPEELKEEVAARVRKMVGIYW